MIQFNKEDTTNKIRWLQEWDGWTAIIAVIAMVVFMAALSGCGDTWAADKGSAPPLGGVKPVDPSKEKPVPRDNEIKSAGGEGKSAGKK